MLAAARAESKPPLAGKPSDNASFVDGEMHIVVDGKVVAGPHAKEEETSEPAPVNKPGKGRRNQKKRHAAPQVGQWLNARFERKTDRGIIVRWGRTCFHVDFRHMAVAGDGSAIRFQDGDQVRVRVLSVDRQGGLPQATMLGKMLPPVKRTTRGAEMARRLLMPQNADLLREFLHSLLPPEAFSSVSEPVTEPEKLNAETEPVD